MFTEGNKASFVEVFFLLPEFAGLSYNYTRGLSVCKEKSLERSYSAQRASKWMALCTARDISATDAHSCLEW